MTSTSVTVISPALPALVTSAPSDTDRSNPYPRHTAQPRPQAPQGSPVSPPQAPPRTSMVTWFPSARCSEAVAASWRADSSPNFTRRHFCHQRPIPKPVTLGCSPLGLVLHKTVCFAGVVALAGDGRAADATGCARIKLGKWRKPRKSSANRRNAVWVSDAELADCCFGNGFHKF
ncbi:unnamed protein product [Schistocephalus solidus]|uniref:Uncharacterized protein n=1 Tax=Schistocephalus solidus TaxID=70667 RepID=A0A183SQJ4_SCHSO|nr:unnamed protein product [Schistocephalus solidus]